MSLAAEAVINAVAARIGANAYTAHPEPFGEEELPAWRVEWANERIETVGLDGLIQQHELEVKLRGYARDVDDINGVLSAMAVEVLPQVFSAPVPYGLHTDGDAQRVAAEEGQAATGVIELPLKAFYFTRRSAPDVIIST
jgi:hypothetical protein